MEWLASLLAGALGWAAGMLKSLEERRRGVEEGARAAFQIEHGLAPFIQLDYDHARLRELFNACDWRDSADVGRTAQAVGDAYFLSIRRTAFEDCRRNDFTEADCAEWQRAFGTKMPPLSYVSGYVQAIRDVITGSAEMTEKLFNTRTRSRLTDRVDRLDRDFDFVRMRDQISLQEPDGEQVGADIFHEAVIRTLDRLDFEQHRGIDGTAER